MKPAVDSYCWHRQFGDWYPDLQTDPGTRMTIWDALDRAHALGAEGISIESCYLPPIDDALLARLRARLEELHLEPVWAWGHPNGLGSGTDAAAARDLVRHIGFARRIGAGVMRICAGSRRTRPADFAAHKAQLVPVLREMAAEAAAEGVVLAVENHLDLLADEMLEVLASVGSPALGVCLDTGNNLRLLEDPAEVAAKLAPHARATHVKDLTARRGHPLRSFGFWPSVPLGQGLVDIPAALRALRDAGYSGLLAVEVDYLDPAYGGDEDRAVAESLAWLRSALS